MTPLAIMKFPPRGSLAAANSPSLGGVFDSKCGLYYIIFFKQKKKIKKQSKLLLF